MNERDIILTGPHRSGTTLVCHLLNQFPDTVALHEPMRVRQLAWLESPAAQNAAVEKFFTESRQTLLSEGKAISKNISGNIPANDTGDNIDSSRGVWSRFLDFMNRDYRKNLRQSQTTRGIIQIDKSLSDDFFLIVKHPAAFTAMLATLKESFKCYAIIRNPLAILASWNSVEFKWEGRSPAAERFDRRLAQRLDEISDRLERQIYLLSWFFDQYNLNLSSEQVITYEDIIKSDGNILGTIVDQCIELDQPLINRNRNQAYDSSLIPVLTEKLLANDSAIWKFYSKESVKELSYAFIS